MSPIPGFDSALRGVVVSAGRGFAVVTVEFERISLQGLRGIRYADSHGLPFFSDSA
jgi:hypothetical protein